jgi:hypothetical protein
VPVGSLDDIDSVSELKDEEWYGVEWIST